jgi:hypothetical protein
MEGGGYIPNNTQQYYITLYLFPSFLLYFVRTYSRIISYIILHWCWVWFWIDLYSSKVINIPLVFSSGTYSYLKPFSHRMQDRIVQYQFCPFSRSKTIHSSASYCFIFKLFTHPNFSSLPLPIQFPFFRLGIYIDFCNSEKNINL